MNSILRAGVILVFIVCLDRVGANDLVKFPEGDAAWTMDITYTDAAKPAQPDADGRKSPTQRRAKQVEVMQAKGVARVRITWVDGRQSERWVLAGLPVIFEDDPRNPDVVVAVESGSFRNQWTEFEIPYSAQAFSWINAGNRQGEMAVNYSQRKCFHYVGTLEAPAALENQTPMVCRVEAWIDAATLLPVARDTDTAHAQFSFRQAPLAEPLIIPAKFQNSINRYKILAGIP